MWFDDVRITARQVRLHAANQSGRLHGICFPHAHDVPRRSSRVLREEYQDRDIERCWPHIDAIIAEVNHQ